MMKSGMREHQARERARRDAIVSAFRRQRMEAKQNESQPARGRPGGPVIWDRARWHAAAGADQSDAQALDGVEHIGVMLRWLWAHGLTTRIGDLAAQGAFEGALDKESALTSEMVIEPAAVFLDHYYGRWLSSIPELGDAAFDDETIDALWSECEQKRDTLERVWAY
jgi:hypothetical protein